MTLSGSKSTFGVINFDCGTFVWTLRPETIFGEGECNSKDENCSYTTEVRRFLGACIYITFGFHILRMYPIYCTGCYGRDINVNGERNKVRLRGG